MDSKLDVGCVLPLNDFTEDTESYTYFWRKLQPAETEELQPDSAWVYTKKDQSGSTTLHGSTGKKYHPGGYIAYLGRTLTETNHTLEQLKYSNWLDESTRFIIVEFQLYTVNTDAYTIVGLIVEIIPGGIFIRRSQVLSLQVQENWNLWVLVFIIFTLFFLYTNIDRLNQQGCSMYFSQFWNYFEMLVLLLSVINLIVHIRHMMFITNSIQDYQIAGKDTYFTYMPVLLYYRSLLICLFLIFLCMIIRLLQTYRLGRRILIMYYTFQFSARSVMFITLGFIFWLLLQSEVLANRLNQPFTSDWLMFFMYKTGFKHLLEHSAYPHKQFVVFLYCFSCAMFSYVFATLYIYYYRVAKGHKILKVDYWDFVAFFKKEAFSKGNSMEKNLKPVTKRIGGGMDSLSHRLLESHEMLMAIKLSEYITEYISQNEIEESN